MSNNYTSRDRIRLAVEHKESDRIPIDFGAMRSTGIAAIAYNRLRKNLGITNGLARMYDVLQALAFPERKVRDRFHIDCIDAGQAFLKSDTQWKEFLLNDGSKCLIPKYVEFDTDEEGTLLLKNKKGIVVGKKPKSSFKGCQEVENNSSRSDLTAKIGRDLWYNPMAMRNTIKLERIVSRSMTLLAILSLSNLLLIILAYSLLRERSTKTVIPFQNVTDTPTYSPSSFSISFWVFSSVRLM